MLSIDHIQIAMPATGETAARQFFNGVLGLSEIPKPADLAINGGCWFVVGTQQIHLGVEIDFRPAKKAHVALRTDALEALRERLHYAGHPTQDDTALDGHARFFTSDPFGNRIEFIAA